MAYGCAVILVILVVARLALPFVLKDYVNRQLNASHDYGGSIGRVTVHLWRGAYRIHDINIVTRDGKVSTPLFSASYIDLSLQWSELIHGKLVSKIIMDSPRVNFVSGPTKQQSQSGTGNNWNDTLESLVPFQINSLVITNGQAHFQNPYSTPPVDIYMSEVFSVATNLSNAREVRQQLPAGIEARGKTLGEGRLYLQCNLNPLAKAPTFQLEASLTNVDLTQLNSFMRAYGKFDVARGQFALFASFAAADEKYDGYVKVFFNDLKVFKWEKERKKDALQIFWQAIVGTLTTLLKNHPHDQLATKVPITGAFQNTDVHLWPTIETLLRNAFIRALVPQPDQKVSVDTARKVDASGAGLESSETNRVQQIEKTGATLLQTTNGPANRTGH
ncbi:MAG TPA: DUF748 domain-containing protein [Candidatus Acidoferrum sp.]|jgi:hypothetical protein|nr:DUF748 domain-containing protein [Candidatus Acidoferrum sp.]